MKRTVTGIAAAALAIGTLVPAAFAATTTAPSYTKAGTVAFALNGTTVSNPYILDSKDSGNTTAFAPVYYFDQLLGQAGITATWDGSTHTWALTDSNVDASTVSVAGGVGTGNTTITLNGVVIKKINTFAAKDPSGGANAVETTYFPAYYVNNIFAAVGINAKWDGTTGLAVSTQIALASVSSINADQIKVVFNQAVDKTTAENIDNYALNNVNLDTNHATTGTPASGDATASLQADGHTVILTAGNNGTSGFGALLQKNTGYVLVVDGVKSADKAQTVSTSSSSFTFAGDTAAPVVTGVVAKAATSTTSVQVTFNEPVQGAGLYYIDGQPATFSAPSPWSNTVTLTSATSLVPGKSYSFQVINEKDSSGNLVSAQQNFSVVSDTVAPAVTSVVAKGDNEIEVTFSKAMNVSELQTANYIKLLDANGVDRTSLIATPATDITATDSSDTTFDIKLTGVGSYFNTTNNTYFLNVVFSDNIKDSVGNALASTTRAVTLQLNTVKPAISSVQYIKPGTTYEGKAYGNGAVLVTFNEDLASAPTLVAGTDFKAITDNGVDESATVGNLVGSFDTNGNNEVIFAPAGAAFSGTSAETLRFSAGIFKDASAAANTNNAVVENVDLTKGTTNSDTTAPVISVIKGHTAAGNVNTITYTLTEANPDYSTVLNTANYRLNGAALPAGSYVTVSGTTVTINLPQNSVSTTGTYAVTVSGIKDLAGNVSAVTTGTAALTDNVAPNLTSATFNSDGTLSLGFDSSVTGAVYSDYTITVNGAAVTGVTGTTPSAGQFTVAAGSGADSGKVVVTFGTPVTTGQVVKVTTAGSTTADAAGNGIVTGTSVSVTK